MPTQNFKNHAKIDPPFHYFVLPVLLANFLFSFVLDHNHRQVHPHITKWWIVLSFALLVLAFKARVYALKAQDRVIRLEERMRLASLLPAAEHATIHTLTTPQIVALRFASDAEAPALARRAVAENLTAKQIKQAIAVWKPDDQRL